MTNSKATLHILELSEKRTCSDSWGTGFLQALLLDNEAPTNEEAGRKCKYEAFDIVGGHTLVPTGRLRRHGGN